MCLRCLNAPAPSLIHRQHLCSVPVASFTTKLPGMMTKSMVAPKSTSKKCNQSLIKVAAIAAILALGGLGLAHDALACGRFDAVILATAGASPATSMTMADEYSPGRHPTAMKIPAAPAVVGAPS